MRTARRTRCSFPSGPDIYDIYGPVQSLFAMTVLIGLVIALVRRWRAWSVNGGMQFAPVLWAGGASLSLISLQLLVDVLDVSEDLRQALFLLSLIPLAFVPFAFLIGLLRSRISRAEAIGDLVAGLATSGEGPRSARCTG